MKFVALSKHGLRTKNTHLKEIVYKDIYKMLKKKNKVNSKIISKYININLYKKLN